MKYIDFRFCSHIFAVILALVYAWAGGTANGHTITYTVLGAKHIVEGFWAVFSTYMLIWFLIGGAIEFVVDLFRPLVKYIKG